MKPLALTIASAALTATALSAVPALAASPSAQTLSPASASASAAPTRQATRAVSNAVTYTQAGRIVTAHQRGQVIATVRLHSISRHGSRGRLVLDVTSKRPITLHARDFVWGDRHGGENAPLRPSRVLHVDGNAKRFTIDYRHITGGAVVWVPGNDVAGVWGVA